MLGFLSAWKGQTHIPFRPTRIPKCSAACRVVTDCLTASNTFNPILLNIRKAPVILKKKMASADWWVPYSFSHGKGAACWPRLGGWCSVAIAFEINNLSNQFSIVTYFIMVTFKIAEADPVSFHFKSGSVIIAIYKNIFAGKLPLNR